MHLQTPSKWCGRLYSVPSVYTCRRSHCVAALHRLRKGCDMQLLNVVVLSLRCCEASVTNSAAGHGGAVPAREPAGAAPGVPLPLCAAAALTAGRQPVTAQQPHTPGGMFAVPSSILLHLPLLLCLDTGFFL
jgi:hypothetical protein